MSERLMHLRCNACRDGFHTQCADWPGRLRCPCSCAKRDDLKMPKSKWAPLCTTKDGEE